MRTARLLSRAVVGAILLPAALHAQVERQRVDTAFAFERGGFVHLSLVSGSIRVVTGTGNEIRIPTSPAATPRCVMPTAMAA